MWYLKQLFPLTYTSMYIEAGLPRLTMWKMWMGRSYSIKNYTLSESDPTWKPPGLVVW